MGEEGKMDFLVQNFSEPKKVKFVVIAFTDKLVTNHRSNYKRQVDT
jgi:hypothetical protein